jgi:transposase
MTILEQFLKLRKEARKLRQDCATYFRAWESQKERAERLEKENRELKKEISGLTDAIGELKKKLDHETEIKEKYQGMLFKANTKKLPATKTADASKRKLGAQTGHKGFSRKNPQRVDQEKEVRLTACPRCRNELKPSNSFYKRIVEDIVLTLNTVVTRYKIQRQWCSHCRKEVCAVPKGIIEHSPFGLNVMMWILIQKYRLRLPLQHIAESLKIQYGMDISEGAIQKILHNAKEKLGMKYGRLIKEIKRNKLKHADETGWRLNGQNAWCWMFSSPESIVYTIEETRGKGVPQSMLGKSPPGVLVRDDYAAYRHLDMPQQSCWAHLLRNCREKAQKENSSQEMRGLYAVLQKMFGELSELAGKDLNASERRKYHRLYHKKIRQIIDTSYAHTDAREIQTRIRNQNASLITALLYPGVPLTNNAAERNIRKMVVTRKISGGSRSSAGAATHAVNMSIIQTLCLKKESLVSELRKLLAPVASRFSLEKGE